MKRLAIFGNSQQSDATDRIAALLEILAGEPARIHIAVEKSYLDFLTSATGLNAAMFGSFSDYDGSFDLALSIGGDGTFLTTAATVGAFQTPIMGINAGHLGYLSAVDIYSAPDIVSYILEGNYSVSPRSVISVETDSSAQLPQRFALNEVAFLKQDTASMIHVDTRIDGKPLAVYRGDGLIVATPTGSTGFNLSVGGPVMAPQTSDWVISPIAAHSLSMRPLVVSDKVTVDITTRSRSEFFMLSIDGKAVRLPIDTEVRLSKAPHRVNVVMLPGYNFINVLRDKLYWGMEGS